MNKFYYFGGAALVLGAVILLLRLITYSESAVSKQNNLFEKISDSDNYRYLAPCQVFQPPIPEEVYFCGERVPIEFFDVREALDRELIVNTYRHSSTIMYIKRANRYFPRIELLLEEYGLPDDMKYLCIAESGLMHVVSPAGAAGFWQFLRNTAIEHGLEVNNFVDERYHHQYSLKAAAVYLQNAYKRFGTWSLAAAAYNMGNVGLRNQINTQKVDSYWDLHLNPETARYVYRIIALKIILSNPEKYGFYIPEEHLYNELETFQVVVDTSIKNLTVFAMLHGTNYKMLRYFNPWIRGNSLPNPLQKEYIIKLPSENVRENYVPENN